VTTLRLRRVAEEIKKEVADILRNDIKDPRVGFVTVTSVEVSGDLRYAKIHVSIMGTPEEQQSTMDALGRATGYIRREIGRRIQLRHVPECTFKLDPSMEHGAKIAKLLAEFGDGGKE